MGYVIKNDNGVYLKLDKGTPVTCTESHKMIFEDSKALNIFNNLPKILKKFDFNLVYVSDLNGQRTDNKPNLLTNNYKVSDNITRWVDKFGICDDILAEAKSRQTQLINDLSNIDKKISNVLHKVEIENSKDLYHGWLLYKEIKSNREKRREIKDELEVINNVFNVLRPNKLSVLSRDKIKQNINRLENRTYTYRIVNQNEK